MKYLSVSKSKKSQLEAQMSQKNKKKKAKQSSQFQSFKKSIYELKNCISDVSSDDSSESLVSDFHKKVRNQIKRQSITSQISRITNEPSTGKSNNTRNSQLTQESLSKLDQQYKEKKQMDNQKCKLEGSPVIEEQKASQMTQTNSMQNEQNPNTSPQDEGVDAANFQNRANRQSTKNIFSNSNCNNNGNSACIDEQSKEDLSQIDQEKSIHISNVESKKSDLDSEGHAIKKNDIDLKEIIPKLKIHLSRIESSEAQNDSEESSDS